VVLVYLRPAAEEAPAFLPCIDSLVPGGITCESAPLIFPVSMTGMLGICRASFSEILVRISLAASHRIRKRLSFPRLGAAFVESGAGKVPRSTAASCLCSQASASACWYWRPIPFHVSAFNLHGLPWSLVNRAWKLAPPSHAFRRGVHDSTQVAKIVWIDISSTSSFGNR